MDTIASPGGAPVSSVISAKSGSFRPRGSRLWLASECRLLTIATTRTPRWRNSSAISIGTMLQPLELITSAGVFVRQAEVAEDALGEPADVFEKHRLPLPVRADDQVVKRQGQLDDRMKPGK